MRGLSLVDVLVILAVIGFLVFLATMDFVRYSGRTMPPAPTQEQGQ